MRKSYIYLTVLVALSLLLAACGTAQGNVGTGTPASGTQTGGGVIGTPSAATATGGLNGTATLAGSTMAPTETTSASTPAATSAATLATTPASGQAENPSLLSNEMKFQLLDQQNQALGQVNDLILDLANLKVAYLLVTLSQSSGGTASQVAVPWSMVKVQAAPSTNMTSTGTPSTTATAAATTAAASSANPASTAQSAFVFTGDQQMLKNAPAFDASSLPQLGQPAANWDASIISYWSGASGTVGTSTVVATPTLSVTLEATVTPTTSLNTTLAASPLQGVALASKVIGFSIVDGTNQAVATLTDAVVDVNTGNLTYVILTVNGKLIPVPLKMLGMNMQNQTLVFIVPVTALQSAPSFDLSSFPDATVAGWDAQIQSFWQNMVEPAATATP